MVCCPKDINKTCHALCINTVSFHPSMPIQLFLFFDSTIVCLAICSFSPSAYQQRLLFPPFMCSFIHLPTRSSHGNGTLNVFFTNREPSVVARGQVCTEEEQTKRLLQDTRNREECDRRWNQESLPETGHVTSSRLECSLDAMTDRRMTE